MNFLVLQTMHLHKIQKYFDELRVLEGLDDCLGRHYIVKIMDFLKNISHIIILFRKEIFGITPTYCFVTLCYNSCSSYRHRSTLGLRCSIRSTSSGSLFSCSCSRGGRGGCWRGTGT